MKLTLVSPLYKAPNNWVHFGVEWEHQIISCCITSDALRSMSEERDPLAAFRVNQERVLQCVLRLIRAGAHARVPIIVRAGDVG